MDKCEDFREYLTALADGELEGVLEERVRRHVETCERCRSEFAGLAKVEGLYRESAPPEVPGREWEKTWAAVEKTLRSPAAERVIAKRPNLTQRLFGWWIFPAAGLAAAVLLVTVIVGLTGTPRSIPTAQVDVVETGPEYVAIVSPPLLGSDDVLMIDVVSAE